MLFYRFKFKRALTLSIGEFAFAWRRAVGWRLAYGDTPLLWRVKRFDAWPAPFTDWGRVPAIVLEGEL